MQCRFGSISITALSRPKCLPSLPHAGNGTDGIAFDKGCNNAGAFGKGELIHRNEYVDYA
jgi:hypothetical protein